MVFFPLGYMMTPAKFFAPPQKKILLGSPGALWYGVCEDCHIVHVTIC